MTAQVESQARHVRVSKPGRETGEKTAFLTGDAAAVNQDHSTLGRSARRNERTGQVQAVEGAYGHGGALGRHAGSSRPGMVPPSSQRAAVAGISHWPNYCPGEYS